MQPARTHTVLVIGNGTNKQDQARQWRERRSMIRPSMPNIICMEAFDKVCEVLNMVHHVRHADWDLRVPTVLWAYWTMCKTLSTQALPKLKYEAGAMRPMEQMKPSPRIASPIDTKVHET